MLNAGWLLLATSGLLCVGCHGYLVVVSEDREPGEVVFDAAVPLLGKRRVYELSTHRSAGFARRLLRVDPISGAVSLRERLSCAGVRYPTLFTAFVDSRSNEPRGVDFLSVPVRVFVTGPTCRSNQHQQEHEKLNAARRWVSETFLSFSVPSEDPAAAAAVASVCLRKSALLASLSALLPASVRHRCDIGYLDVSDHRFVVEPAGGDLVAAVPLCLQRPVWKLAVTLNTECVPCAGCFDAVQSSEHRLRIVFHHPALNDSDLAHRVRREMRASSPYFDQALYVSSVMEELKAGSPVATLRARDPDNAQLSYSMVSLLDARSQGAFAIDAKSGVVTTNAKLDRELVDVHYFHVVAAAETFPPRSATTTLQVNVLDANDHAPEFEARSYEAGIRETATAGSPVITVRATDQDIGRNAELEYVLANQTAAFDGGEAFRVDGKTGAVTTRTALDRERTQTFELVVLAVDQAKPASDRRTATATIHVRVADDNDNYPQFSERTYSVDIAEDVDWTKSPVIATISASDADEGANAAIRYAIVSGNTQSQFAMDSLSGQVSLVKALDFETVRRFRLVVRAQDGGSPARSNTTQLLVNVVDVNDNAPRFYTSLFQETVSENVPAGFSIVRVQAYDADEGVNAEVRYALGPRDGAGASTADIPLAVDPRSGWLHTTRELDRETHARYQLQVVASDGGQPPRQATASVVVTVSDVNDNDPVFDPRQYESAVSESAAPGTPVAVVTASDRDENARLTYEITGGNVRGRFSVAAHAGQGLVTVAQPLDYKQEKRFVLTVTATDAGRRSDNAIVTINVTDANNFAPAFENAPYAVSVFEDAAVGTTVVVVEASDGDVGQNAHITYSLGLADEPASPDFEINSVTGAISLLRPLDREATAGYLLTVTARDGGIPSLADTTDVEVTVADVNDSPPVFRRDQYTAVVGEDALVGTSVLQIAASDADSGLNGRIRYALADADDSFAVDPTSGVVRTAKALDRESVARVTLTALAIDRGAPALTGTALIVIDVDDVNDSPPAFPSERMTLYIAENSPVGSTVGTILAHDPDQGANAVVTYSIIGGEDSTAFSLVTRPGQPGAELLTMTELDFESPRKRFELVVRAASAPLRADARVEVVVTDVNDNAPKLSDFQVVFNNFRSCFPTGPFGRVPAFDADVTDALRFRILSGNNADLVTLDEATGALTLSPRLDTNVPKTAVMEVSVSDGVNEAKAVMTLTVRLVTDDMLFNSVTVRLADMTERAFLSPLLDFFVDGLAAILPCPRDNIYVLSVQDDTDLGARILNVSFSARRPELSGPEFYPPSFLQERVYLNRAILARLATVQVLPFDDNLCVREPCLNFEQCLTVLKFGNASGFVASDTVLFRPIYPVTTFACRCPHGFTGNREHYLCDVEVNLCYSSPCGEQGRCERREGGYTCVCQPGFTGRNCEVDVSLDTCQPGICRSGSACSPLVRGGFRCEGCAAAGGNQHYTSLCQLRTRSFDRQAFLTFPSLRQRHRLHIKLRFSTQSRYGLLLYNGRYNERHDFIALEIVDGAVHFSFSLGSDVTTSSVEIEGGVSDGRWHQVEVSYFNKTALVSVDDCDPALALAHGPALGARWGCANASAARLHARCGQLTETCHRFLDLTGPMQLGGLPRLPTAFQVHTKDFVGCIGDLHIDHALVDLNSFVADNGSAAGCPQRRPFCESAPCANGGACADGWDTFVCECPETFGGKDCSEPIGRPWRFQGDGVLSFNPLLRPIQLPWTNALSVRTLQPDTFLMSIQIGQNTTATLTLEGGEAVYSVSGESLRLSHDRVSDGRWHRVAATWATGGDLWLELDHGRRRVSSAPAAKLQGLYVGKILIGGPDSAASALPADYDYLDGCVQDVRVGMATASLSRPTVRENVSDGCDSPSQCSGPASPACPAHADCIDQWERGECRCRPGRVGATCLDVCSLAPCRNNGRCITSAKDPRGYECECSALTSGPNCEVMSDTVCPAAWWGAPVCGPCRCDTTRGYAADCSRSNGTCICQENHYEAAKDGACVACRCYATGSLDTGCDADTGQCRCRASVIGQRCDACANPYAEVTSRGCEVIYDGCPRSFASGLWWSRAAFGAVAKEACPPGSVGNAARACTSDLGWDEPDLFNCTSDNFLELRKVLGHLESGSLSLGTFVAVKVAADLKTATTEPADLRGADLLVSQRLLRELLQHELGQVGLNLTHARDKDFVNNVVAAVSAVMQDKYQGLWETVTRLTGNSAAGLVSALRRYLVVLAASQQDTYTRPFESVSSNAALGLDVVTAESLLGFETTGSRSGETVVLPDTTAFLLDQQSLPMLSFPKYDNYLSRRDKFDPWSRVLVPLSVLSLPPPPLPSAQGYHRGGGGGVTGGGRAVLAYLQLRHSLLPARYDATVARRWGVALAVGAPIVAVAIHVTPPQEGGEQASGSDGANGGEIGANGALPRPLLLRLWLDEALALALSPRLNPQCVRWTQPEQLPRDAAQETLPAAGALGGWSRDGCTTQLPESWLPSVTQPLLVNCTCQQVGIFTVLVDQIDAQFIPEPGCWEALASYVSFGLALTALALTWLALASLRGLETNSNAIHKNLVLCVLLAQATFFVALVSRKHSTLMEFPCRLLALALHYLWLCVFAWALVDAGHLRRMLTEVRDVNHGPMRFYYTTGYGLPAVIVALSVAVRADHYGNFYFCWLSIYESVVWALIGPICVMMLATLATLASCVRAAFTLKDHVLGFGSLRTLLWIAVVSLPLTGVVWVLAALSVSEPDPLLSFALSAATFLHAAFTMVGQLGINHRVRARLHRAALRLAGRKAPPDDGGSCAGSGTTQAPASRSALAYRAAGALGSTRRHVGISASSTTSRSTKTGSSPYRSDAHLRHTSTSTSNCTSEPVVGRPHRQHKHSDDSRLRRESDSDSEVSVDGRSLELASSHSSDDDESSARRRIPPRLHSVGVSTPVSYLPNIREDVSTSPRSAPRHPVAGLGLGLGLGLASKSQLFPNLQPVFAPRWSRQLPDSCLPPSMGGHDDGGGGRWSGTASDNEDAGGGGGGGLKAEAAHENFLLRGDVALPGSQHEVNKLHDKYLFPYTAEEDHVGNPLNRESGGREDVWLASLRATSPSPLLYPGSVLPTSAAQTDSEKDTSETPV